MRDEYITLILKMLETCQDVELLDLIHTLLQKSK